MTVPFSFTFKYTRVQLPPSEPFPEGQTVHRPIAEVMVVQRHGGRARKCRVLLDTGADRCMFPMSLAAPLGLDTSQMPKGDTAGIGGSEATCYADVSIILSTTMPIRWGDTGKVTEEPVQVSFNTRAGFTPGLNRFGYGVLGQTGFFERYAVRFDLRREVFTVEVGP